jgi:hypothetical protein
VLHLLQRHESYSCAVTSYRDALAPESQKGGAMTERKDLSGQRKIYILTTTDDWWVHSDVTYCAHRATAERLEREFFTDKGFDVAPESFKENIEENRIASESFKENRIVGCEEEGIQAEIQEGLIIDGGANEDK